ncbi:aldehyde oxidase GLOX-like [Silene latifolia]|uniref:aldehyde oxidase GLOX-like n=1 Tax=Silene latifolia TaxID=37657 RepID=UPI003D76B18F
MHMQLLHNDRVVFFDRTDFGASNLSLPNGQCRINPRDEYLKVDCTAHSAEYDISTNSIRPLNIQTDTWCSSGTVLGDGRLAQTGGYNDGERDVKTFQPDCTNISNCDWVENPNALFEHRWYATNHVLPDGSSIILGGRRGFSYEFFPKTSTTSTLTPFPFLAEVNERGVENNLYAFVFLNVDGNLFVFANNRAILFDYKRNVVVRNYTTVPGGDPRNYPSTGSAVLLPIKNLELGAKAEAEVLICGGARHGAYVKAASQSWFLPALNSCARLKINDPNATWVMETMPMPRIMSDMLVLPNGDVLIINGAGAGTAGWELGREPVLSPVTYHPDNVLGSRFEVMKATTIPRMYHSCAVLLRDGRVLVGGSNPHHFYNFTNVLFPTDLTLEAFSPPYLDSNQASIRPSITSPGSSTIINYGTIIKIGFSISGLVNPSSIKVTMVRPPFNTHSFSMSQRNLVLTITAIVNPLGLGQFEIQVRTPGSSTMAPPGYYMLFVVHQNVPSKGIWVKLA